MKRLKCFKSWGTWFLSLSLALGCWLGMGFSSGNPMMGHRSWAMDDAMPVAIAAAPLKDAPIELTIHLGTATGDLKFVPDDIAVIVGTRYKFILDNPSPQKHYFTAKDFADASWTQKVEAGNVEVKGAIHELELKPGAIAEWVVVPLKPGTYELHCSIAGHAEAGMVGQITITDR